MRRNWFHAGSSPSSSPPSSPLFFLLFAFDRREPVGKFHVNIFVVHPGQFGRNVIAPVGFGDVDGR